MVGKQIQATQQVAAVEHRQLAKMMQQAELVRHHQLRARLLLMLVAVVVVAIQEQQNQQDQAEQVAAALVDITLRVRRVL
jgi:tryptophan synthase alpha subunit